MVETLHGLDALESGTLRVCEIVRHVHHIDGEAYETAQIFMHDITRPARPDGSKTGTVSDVEHRTKFMFQLVGSPVVLLTTTSQAIMHH